MNRENVVSLIETLRSGEYQQGTKQLNDGKGCFCILGVMCDLFIQKTGEGHWDSEMFVLDCLTAYNFPPDRVRDFFGIGRIFCEELYRMNDQGCSFGFLSNVIACRLLKETDNVQS